MAPDDVEALLVHEPFVRAVARALLQGDARVDDVVQETWLAAMQAEQVSRSWLGGVVRNVARTLLRRDAVRARHEPPPRDPAPSTGEIAAQEEIRRKVLDQLLAIDEPYRSALLMRYYEDLPPREVARRLQVPVETARTRVRRGLAMLRALLAYLLGCVTGARVALIVAALAVGGSGLVAWRALSGRGGTGGRTAQRAPLPGAASEQGDAEAAEANADLVTIDGVVLAPAGHPAAGATVAATLETDSFYRGWSHVTHTLHGASRARGVMAEATTAADGRFALAVTCNSRVVLQAHTRDAVTLRTDRLDASTDLRGVVLRLHPAACMEGAVLGTGNSPLAGVRVLAWPTSRAWSPEGFSETRTDEGGVFRLDGLVSGDHQLVVAHEDHAGRVLQGMRAPDSSLRIRLEPGLLVEGIVRSRSGGMPVPGARVTVVPADFSYAPSVGHTDEFGRFAVRAGRPAPFRFNLAVDAVDEGYVILSELVWTAGHPIEVTVGPVRTLRGRTVMRGPQGETVPAPGVPLQAYARRWWSSGISYGGPKAGRRLRSDDGGRFEIAVFPVGDGLVQVPRSDPSWSHDPALREEAHGLQFSGKDNDIVLHVARRREVAGRVEGPDGGPFEGARIGAGDKGSTRAESAEGMVYSDAAGRFVLRGVRAGQVFVHAVREGVGRGTAAVPEAGELVVKMEAGRMLEGRVTDEQGRGIMGVEVATRRYGVDRRVVHTDREGRYALDVYSDKVELTFAKPGHVTLTREAATTVVLPRTATVSGRVASDSGAPIPDAIVRSDIRTCFTDADGRFEIDAPPGKGTLSAWADGYVSPEQVKVTLPHEGELLVEMTQALSIRGRVTDLEGNPVRQTRVEARRASYGPGSYRIAFTDLVGRFEVRGLAPGCFTVAAMRHPMVFEHREGVEAGTMDLEFRAIQPVKITGRVAWPEGVEPERVQVYAYRDDRPLPRTSLRGRRPPQPASWYTQPDGEFRFERLLGERFSIWVQHATLASEVTTGVAAGSTDVVVRMTSGVSITGIVTGKAKPQQAVHVLAEAADGRGASRYVNANDDGSFELKGLAPGRSYHLRATTASRKNRSRDLKGEIEKVKAGATGVAIVLKEAER